MARECLKPVTSSTFKCTNHQFMLISTPGQQNLKTSPLFHYSNHTDQTQVGGYITELTIYVRFPPVLNFYKCAYFYLPSFIIFKKGSKGLGSTLSLLNCWCYNPGAPLHPLKEMNFQNLPCIQSKLLTANCTRTYMQTLTNIHIPVCYTQVHPIRTQPYVHSHLERLFFNIMCR